MLLVALWAVLCGAEDGPTWRTSPERSWILRGFLKLEHGPPSHDTFSRLFRLLDPAQFRLCFQRFMDRFAEACQGVVAIDAKTLRCSFDKAKGKSALHIVSAWSCDQRMVLGQLAVDAKSNEITALPKLLKLLSLEGCTVTVDALNCQREIAQQIIDQKGDYLMALKGNWRTLHEDGRTFLDDPKTELAVSDRTVGGDHGCIETRSAMLSTDIAWLQQDHQWPGLVAIGKMARVREAANKTTTETAYYLLSAAMTPERFGEIARCHWTIENRLHWCLDAVMNEDQTRNIGSGIARRIWPSCGASR